MAAPVQTPSIATSLAAVAVTEVVYQNGLIILPNGKQYKVTHLSVDNKDLIGGKAQSNPDAILSNQALQKSLLDMLNAVWKDQLTNDALTKQTFDSFTVSVDDKKTVSVIGRTASAAQEVFKTNSITYASIEKSLKSLIDFANNHMKKKPLPNPPKRKIISPTFDPS